MRAVLPRFLVGAGVAALVLVVAAGIAAVQYSAWALDSTGGGIQTGPASSVPHWVGYDLTNRSAAPITLREFVPRARRNLRILDARVVDLRRGDGLGFSSVGAPLPMRLRAELDASVPVEGFVLPAGSRLRYEVVVLVQQIRTDRPAELGRSAIAYSALGLDQGASFSLVTRFRAAT